jgi:hypothetical protein
LLDSLPTAALEKLAGPVHERVYDLQGYFDEVLNCELTAAQQEICRMLRTPPYKVAVRAANTVGKTFVAAAIVNWWHDTFRPGVALTTAPKLEQVRDILWKEIRRQRRGRRCRETSLLPKACRMQTAPDHFAVGMTARDVNSFQGQHEAAVLIVFDEAEGVDPAFWDAAESMLHGDVYGFLAIYNPLSQSGPTVEAERSGQFHVVTMSALDHPNILDEIAGREPKFKRAVRLGRLREMMAKWGRRCDPEEPGAVELAGEWWLPGPMAEARILGRRPSAGNKSVWATWVFEKCLKQFIPLGGAHVPMQIGFDVGEMGDDPSSFCVRSGGNIVALEEYHGPKDYSSGRKAAIKAASIAEYWGAKVGIQPNLIPIVVDCGGGYGTEPLNYLRQLGFNALPFMGAWTAADEEQYPNARSEMWVFFSRIAADGGLSFAHLGLKEQEMLRTELTAAEYTINLKGQMAVERKSEIKKRIGRSTDNADAMLQACVNVGMIAEKVAGQLEIG